jgi:hypothetical protein
LAGKKLAEKIAVFLESQWHNILIWVEMANFFLQYYFVENIFKIITLVPGGGMGKGQTSTDAIVWQRYLSGS